MLKPASLGKAADPGQLFLLQRCHFDDKIQPVPGLGPGARPSNRTCSTHELHWRIKKLVGLSGEVMKVAKL